MSVEVMQQLEEIRHWLLGHSSVADCKSNEDFMRLAIEAANHARLLMVVSSRLIPEPEFKGYKKEAAVIVGHFVRLYKLYDALTFHVAERHGEIGDIFARLIFETFVRMQYLMKNGDASIRHFIFVSHRPKKDILNDLREKQSQRKLIPIEMRILGSIEHQLRTDGIAEKDILENKQWELDGKNFRALMRDVGIEDWYAYSFAPGSSFVHGNWLDIRPNHLTEEGGLFLPNWEHYPVDPRSICPMTALSTTAVRMFLDWNKTDPDKYVWDLASQLEMYVRKLDEHHEKTVMHS